MGPTASGKTGLSIELAKSLKTEIISVDSRQFYKEMKIGTAKPSPDQLAEAKHHFIDNLSITEPYSAGHYAKEAHQLLARLFKDYDTVVAVGGSTLFYRALLEGIDEFPQVTSQARDKVKALEAGEGLLGLQSALLAVDPEYYGTVDIYNPRRVVRALEISYSGAIPYSAYLNKKQHQPDYQIIKIGLNLNRDVLYERIDQRCDEMIANGLVQEVEALLPYRHLIPLHTVGYTEFFEYLDGKNDLQTAIKLFKQHTRNYAKRQMTWLRKEPNLNWISQVSLESLQELVRDN